MGLLSFSPEEKRPGVSHYGSEPKGDRVSHGLFFTCPPVFLASVRYRPYMFNASLFCPGYLAFSPWLYLFPGSIVRSVLNQLPTLTASPGGPVRLISSLSKDFIVAGYYIFWYQQKSGSFPQFLLKYFSDSDTFQGSGVTIQFSGFKDALSNARLLFISGIQSEDEAHYYC